jgi:hypothetical protein
MQTKMVTRPDSPLGKSLLRLTAILLSVAPLTLWFMWMMVPVDHNDPWAKMPLLWIIYPAGLFLAGAASWIYWWSFYETPRMLDLPLHAEIFRIYIVGYLLLSTGTILMTVIQLMLRKW